MKILFALSRGNHFFYYDRVVRRLHAAGHEIQVACAPPANERKENFTDRALQAFLTEAQSCRTTPLLIRDKRQGLISDLRELATYANYFRPEHPMPWFADYLGRKRLSPRFWRLAESRLAGPVIRSGPGRRLLRWSERLIPVDLRVKSWLERNRPDAVFASPFIFRPLGEIDYVKAAKALGIPTVAAVLSWDNLSSKETVHVPPDYLFVWNKPLAEEAVRLHDLPPQRVYVTGAPVYDPWFELTPSRDRAAFCAEVGLDPARPFLLYLCSAANVSRLEPDFVRELFQALTSTPATRDLQLLIRPHPFYASLWAGFQADGLTVWPRQGDRPDSDQSRQDYFDSLHQAVGVMAVNTTGFLEAAVADRPCLTILDQRYEKQQLGRAHFQFLLAADFIQAAHDLGQATGLVGGLLAGADPQAAQRRAFVQSFLRPRGLNRPAHQVMAEALEAVAQGRPLDPAGFGL